MPYLSKAVELCPIFHQTRRTAEARTYNTNTVFTPDACASTLPFPRTPTRHGSPYSNCRHGLYRARQRRGSGDTTLLARSAEHQVLDGHPPRDQLAGQPRRLHSCLANRSTLFCFGQVPNTSRCHDQRTRAGHPRRPYHVPHRQHKYICSGDRAADVRHCHPRIPGESAHRKGTLSASPGRRYRRRHGTTHPARPRLRRSLRQPPASALPRGPRPSLRRIGRQPNGTSPHRPSSDAVPGPRQPTPPVFQPAGPGRFLLRYGGRPI
ncbi:hypothetical protein VTI74DRAFT_4268 [Chaetomium olivicolor]